jgi:crotonobetainyl-CoA:carnitine CoA-transferase CaiB-like acyl-CoA transferase
VLGTIKIVNRAIKWPGEIQAVPDAPPVLGQHTDMILGDLLGLSTEQVAALRAANVVA